MLRRTTVMLGLVVLTLSACSTPVDAPDSPDAPASPDASTAPGAVTLEAVDAGPREDVPSALRDADDPALPDPLVDPARIISGGPPPDGIPAIDDPRFEPADQVDWLADDEAVIALSLGDEHRAYPVQVLMWHEIVNDTVGGRPVAVTYCPLCNSALAFDRQVGDRLLSFGTSGRLYLSALVMYDRQTESLWSQIERTSLAGVLAGTELDLVPVTTVRWADWRGAHPEGWVLSRETGFERDYGRNPYVGYDAIGNDGTFLDESADGRYPAKERVVAFPDAAEAVVVLLKDLSAVGVAEITVDAEPVVLFASRGLASALQADDVAGGELIAATGAFRPEADGRELSFTAPTGSEDATDDDSVVAVDAETGSGWDILGRAVTGPLTGTALEQVPHLDTFWFAQAAFRPDTEVIGLGS